MKPLIIPFTTEHNNRYIYDTCTNYVYPVTELEEKIILNYRTPKEQLIAALSNEHEVKQFEKAYRKVTQWIEKDKAFFPNLNGRQIPPPFPDEDEFKRRLANTTQMTLGVTERCNLRCRYCVFSGIYTYQRTHSSKWMNWPVAQKAIDYFLSLINSPDRTSSADHVYLSFYGGEPLLNFALIKKCVEYTAGKKTQCPIVFSMTTNGTLLRKEIIEFLIAHKFRLVISLDGPREQHDKNRVFRNDRGTFLTVMKNLELIRQIDEDYFCMIGFNAVYTPSTDLMAVLNFFSKQNPFVQDRQIKFNPVQKMDSEYFTNLSPETMCTYQDQLVKICDRFIKYMCDKNEK